jgi:hypothetical protein
MPTTRSDVPFDNEIKDQILLQTDTSIGRLVFQKRRNNLHFMYVNIHLVCVKEFVPGNILKEFARKIASKMFPICVSITPFPV